MALHFNRADGKWPCYRVILEDTEGETLEIARIEQKDRWPDSKMIRWTVTTVLGGTRQSHWHSYREAKQAVISFIGKAVIAKLVTID